MLRPRSAGEHDRFAPKQGLVGTTTARSGLDHSEMPRGKRILSGLDRQSRLHRVGCAVAAQGDVTLILSKDREAFSAFPAFVRRGEVYMLKRIGILVMAAVIGMLGLEVGEKMSIPGVSGLISPAHAVIGRPGTPRSVAGVARRTYRRCATGVYRC